MTRFKSWVLTDVLNDVWVDSFGVANDTLRLPTPSAWSVHKRTLRGGGWFFVPMWARSSHRDAYIPSARYVGLGLRLVATSAAAAVTRNGIESGEKPE